MNGHIIAHVGLSLAILVAAVPAAAAPPSTPHPVVEFRQYKLVDGKQDEFVKLFDSKFVETQEATGIRLIGQFTDHDRRDRFTWIREFPSMEARAKSLQDFYFGPVWAANKAVANPMLFDNDNVLLLRAAGPDSGFGPSAKRAPVGSSKPQSNDPVFAVIEYLWLPPDDGGFAGFFLNQVRPQLNAAGLPVLGAYVPEEEPNNFPRLPVRTEKKMMVWFTTAPSVAEFNRRSTKLHASTSWKTQIAKKLEDFQERPPQILDLDPTPRSALR